MAPMHASYSTALDIEGLVQSSMPAPRRSLPWVAVIAGLFGAACAAVLVLQTNVPTTSFQAQARPVLPRVAQQAVASQQASPTLLQRVGQGLATLSLTTMANLGTPYITPAAELDVLSTPTPTTEYIYDDGGLLSKATLGDLEGRLPAIEARTGYRINVVTLRKLVVADDAFQFADNLIETWYPTAELGDKKVVLVIVKNSKEGGLVGGPSFNKNVPNSVLESIINDNVGKLLPQEKFNQAVLSTVDRLEAVLSGSADPGAPKLLYQAPEAQSQTYKTKEETDSKRSVYITVFGALVAISFIAPMVQFFGYTKDD